MTALLSWRVWAAIALAVALAASHWKAYHLGGAECRTEQAQDSARLTAQALAASEENRVKEKALNLSNERIRNELVKEKALRAADAVATAGKLRDFESALDRVASADTGATSGIDGAFARIAGECASALTTLDEGAKHYRSIAQALQDYTRSMRVNK